MIKTTEGKEKQEIPAAKQTTLPKCGIVMPISAIDNCSAEHWSEVLAILKDVIKNAEFEPNLVSDADEIGIIQKRIIQNLYSNEVIVCDVSCKNPNVMFELGIRLAFDKPTIIIKDDKTDYTFDTSIIEHLGYPRDLRFSKIVSFKENLKKKIQATYNKATKDPNYSTFLKNFGEYKIAQLAEKEISSDKYILNTLEELKSELKQIKRNQVIQSNSFIPKAKRINRTSKNEHMFKFIEELIEIFVKMKGLNNRYEIYDMGLYEELFDFVMKEQKIIMFSESPYEVEQIIKTLTEIPF